MLALEITFADNTSTRIITDHTWKMHHCDAFAGDRTFGYRTQYAEDIDMRKIPLGWRDVGFDDRDWAEPFIRRPDHHFVEQITPPLEHRRRDPAVVKRKADGHYFYDFGHEIVGHTRIRVRGSAGHRIVVRHGEELSGPDTVRYDMRAKCRYEEFPVLSGHDDTIEFYDYKAFRYMEILDAPAEPEVWVDVRHHPFDEQACTLQTSDDLLDRIFVLCKRGVQMGSQGGFLDCPTREKGQYLGDALIASRSMIRLTADADLTRKALVNFQNSQRICPGMMAVAPGSYMQEIAEYSLQWPLLLEDCYRNTGDKAFLRRMIEAGLDPLLDYFAKFESDAGLLTDVNRDKWVLVDWPKNLRDDYDYEYARDRENTVLNAFYYASLRTAARLCRELGRDAGDHDARADRIRRAFAERMLDRDTGLFVDAPGSKHSSLHANAVPLAFGLVDDANVPRVIELIRRKRLSCGVYIAPFVIEACYRAGEFDLAYDLITSKDEHSWHEMLAHGATTCMEAWGPDQKWNTSWCHPWSSGPVFLITDHVCGLTPAEPGWKTVRIAPKLPAKLDHLQLRMPTPRGTIDVSYRKGDAYRVEIPSDMGTAVDAPEGIDVVVEKGRPPVKADQPSDN